MTGGVFSRLNGVVMKLVLPDHTEIDIEGLEQLRRDAIGGWQKADKTEQRALLRKRNCEGVVRGCAERIRLLRILSS